MINKQAAEDLAEAERLAAEEAERLAKEAVERAAVEAEAQAKRDEEERKIREEEEAKAAAVHAEAEAKAAEEAAAAAAKAEAEAAAAAAAEATQLAEESAAEAKRVAAEEAAAAAAAKEAAKAAEEEADADAAAEAAAAKAKEAEETAAAELKAAREYATQVAAELAAAEEAERVAAAAAAAAATKEAEELARIKAEEEARTAEEDARAAEEAVQKAADEAERQATAEAGAATLLEKRKFAQSFKKPKMRRSSSGAAKAMDRLKAENESMKRREMSLNHRKQAMSSVLTNAREAAARADALGGVIAEEGNNESIMPQTPMEAAASQLGAELFAAPANVFAPSLLKPARAGGGGGLAPPPAAASTRAKPKKSIRKSIRNMFKSKRSKKAPPPALQMGGGGGGGAAPGGAVRGTGSVKRKAGAVTVAEYISGNIGDTDGYEALDDRAIDAAKWTDKSVVQMIHEIKTRGHVNGSGQMQITFKQLFDETADIFDALVGILKTARKYQVLFYDGEAQLWQGKDDAKIITLLKDTHSGVVINRRPLNKLGAKVVLTTSLATQNAKCEKCGKTVYSNEFVGASGKAFHKACFRCATCNKVMNPIDYCTVDSLFFCPTCYKKNVMAAGGAGKEHDAATFVPSGVRLQRRSSDV